MTVPYKQQVAQPFINDQPKGEDSLNIAKELQSLADVLMLRSLEPPLAVGILGGWGSGKSFGMHLIEQQITHIRCQELTAKQTWGKMGNEPHLSAYVGHVYQIKFNAWSYAKSELWPSLMQTIFAQLDRQLTLEHQLRNILGSDSDLSGGNIWYVLNQMNDSDRNAILESELSAEVFSEFKQKQADVNILWDILSQVRKEEQEKLEQTEKKLEVLEAELQSENEKIEKQFEQQLEQLEKDFSQEVKKIESNVEQEMTNLSTLIVFLSQLKETIKDDFSNSIFRDFLNSCNFKDRKDLENQFPILKSDNLSKANLLDVAQELIEQQDSKIRILLDRLENITYFLEEQPSHIVGLIEFTQKDKKTLLIFLATTCLPFIVYFLIISVIPKFLPAIQEISTALHLWLTSLSAIPAISMSVEIFKRIQISQLKIVRLLQIAQENVKAEKQKLNQTKKDRIEVKINQRKAEYEQNQVRQINENKELAQKQIAGKQQEMENLQVQLQKQKKRVGLTAEYKSLLDFVNHGLEKNSYHEFLGIMHQIQVDLQDLSEHLTYKPGNTNPEKIEVLKTYFPRGPARIVLYIDDLDRCPPDKVVQVLEAVQLLLNTEIFVIVLAIDDRYIGRALEYIYRGVLKRGATPSGLDYLEKIIQIPYRMRPISKDVTESYLKSLVDIEKEYQQNYSIENNRKIEPSANSDSLVTFAKLTSEEFKWIVESCQHVDLSPRTAKRLVNICKILKIIWTPLPDDKTGKQEPEPEYKQTLIAFLALAGRYLKPMRKLLEEIYLEFEETDQDQVIIEKEEWLKRLQKLDIFMDRYNQREWKKFKNDFYKMSPRDNFYFEKRTFNLATSFCFIGDIGYDPDDSYNREYRVEDGKKIYGFNFNQ